jgi:hypothetical protein
MLVKIDFFPGLLKTTTTKTRQCNRKEKVVYK